MGIKYAKRSDAEVDRLYRQLNALSNRNAWVLAIPEEQLKEWFVAQCGWWGRHIQKLDAALTARGERWDIPTAELSIRLGNAKDTLALLRDRQHVVVCRQHGIQGVEDDEVLERVRGSERDGVPETLAEILAALADFGVYDGSITGWERDCERCQQGVIKQRAQRAVYGEGEVVA